MLECAGMRRVLHALAIFGVAVFGLPKGFAAPLSITYAHSHFLFTVRPGAQKEWKSPTLVWQYHGVPAKPPTNLVTGSGSIEIPEGWMKGEIRIWNEDAIANTLQKEVAADFDRSAGTVTISRSASGSIVFAGQGLPGRSVDLKKAVALTIEALTSDVSTIELPVTDTPPTVIVMDSDLRSRGIKEVVTVGESVFTGSPVNRRHNIATGIARFNGHIIPQGEVFSFSEMLGPVNESTGYRKELVIQGDTTIPDYGGGLCQVSSTAYRGPWEYGMPIVQRKNHSYAVRYYAPQGTDATVYPPRVDLKFKNDTPGDLLIQSFIDDRDHAYFIYYGTHDDRQSAVIGPFITDRTPAPAGQRTIYTTEIPVGETRKAGEAHDGLKAVWYRQITRVGTGSVIERFFSDYEARPLTVQVGVAPDEMARRTTQDLSPEPTWLPASN
jgi:vancomycin resistance protein YoaR